MNDKIIDAEIVVEKIVACPGCGRKNRLRQHTGAGVYRCGACGIALADPFPKYVRPVRRKPGAAVWGPVLVLGFFVALLVWDVFFNHPEPPPPAPLPSLDTSPLAMVAQEMAAHPTPVPEIKLPVIKTPELDSRFDPHNVVIMGVDGKPTGYADGSPFPREDAPAPAAASPDRPPAPSSPLTIAQPLPANGEIQTYTQEEPIARFEIESTAGQNYLVKLAEASTGHPVLTVFVRGGETVKIKVPLGTYVVKYASGDAWYGYEQLFGPRTVYSKAREDFMFTRIGDQVNGYRITLYPVLNGNLRTEHIQAREF